ncbi:MAG TPA: histidine kinase dimerization/phospho-acceptor domain-containing protein [Thermodesulfobacteriota bacterium]|nr:histidine kinase dimerization/phospho-acceptor domain-containing protein [Thermodesulfobacteriota bacterium]
MGDYKIWTAQGDPQSLGEIGGRPDSTSSALNPRVEENMVSLLKVMSHDIRGPLMSMVSTLKLLNRGYYGKMDEVAADKIREVLSNATRLTEMAEHYLEALSAEPKAR